jgi:glycosyltransferase involved in cell wall biosynthesis
MRIFASTVGRNEEGRWIDSMLLSVQGQFDGHFFYDDGSSDNTPGVASSAGCTVVSRPSDVPSFLEHGSDFRQAAWAALEVAMGPREGDWILSIDCDELLLGDVRTTVAAAFEANSVLVPIPEVFGFDTDGWPLVRTDGFWATIRGTRLFRYQRGGVFSGKAMGSGSEPQYATRGPFHAPDGLWLMHLGYARREDQVAKHRRYSALAHGHNDSHVQSIVQQPTLARWDGPQPAILERSA